MNRINNNVLDNLIANLRVATLRQNNWNARKRKGNCNSKYKGINRAKDEKKLRARKRFNEREIFIGHFDDERTAAKAYDAKARDIFGEFACLNFPAVPAAGKRKNSEIAYKTAD